MTVDSECTCVDAGNNFNVHLSLGCVLCVDYECLYLLTCVHPAENYIHGIAMHGKYMTAVQRQLQLGFFNILY